jgi:hypothetical protein
MPIHNELSNNEYALQTLSDGISLNMTENQIATLLNQRGVVSIHGLVFTPAIIRTELFKLRRTSASPSTFKIALLRMLLAGRITVNQAILLFSPRPVGRKKFTAA